MAQERVVNVYNWSDYIDKSIIEDFTKETGIKVVYDVFDSNEILETKLLAGGSGYDIVVPTQQLPGPPDPGRRVPEARQVEAAQPRPTCGTWSPSATAKYDPGNEYSINYMWGTVGLGYNKKKVQEALGIDKIDSWDVFFNPEKLSKLADCGVYVLDSPTDIIPTTLKYLGLDPESTVAGGPRQGRGDAAGDPALHPQVPFVGIHQRACQRRHLPGGRLVGRRLPGPRPRRRGRQGVDIDYVVPKEGAEMWFDQMAIPADAQHVAEAHEFLNYMMKPEVAAKAYQLRLFRQRQQGFAAVHRQGDVRTIRRSTRTRRRWPRLFTVAPYDPKTQRTVTRIWTKIVTGQ